MYRLVEACSGTGDLVRAGTVVQRVRYRLDRYQGMTQASGLPIPGLHRLEGTVKSEARRSHPLDCRRPSHAQAGRRTFGRRHRRQPGWIDSRGGPWPGPRMLVLLRRSSS